MDEEDKHNLVSVVEERVEQMVPITGGIPTVRVARFIRPSLTCIMAEEHFHATLAPPLLKLKACNIQQCHFIGWRHPQKTWDQWVDQMRPGYGALWKKLGIYDSIIASTYEFKKDKELILGLAASWCPDTNTFIFPWGEATLTLEDISVLGGLSVMGEPVTCSLAPELLDIQENLIKIRSMLLKSRARKAGHSEWIKHCMGSNDELEHVAFLTLWISRYVLPKRPGETITKEIFPIAIHLSRSTRIALAPAVLASLYRDLRLLKEQAIVPLSRKDNKSAELALWAPFHIMQLWAWERFSTLQPIPNALNPGEPRAARWHKLCSKSAFDSVMSCTNSLNEFSWRPYSFALNNWQHPLYYKDQPEWAILSPDVNEELLSFSHFLVPSELVGLDCIEQYLPHRVGMQFGMDQDIPGPFARANANWKVAWETYEKSFKSMNLYIPARLFESNVTVQYFNWWNQSGSPVLDVSLKAEKAAGFVSPGIPCDDEDKMTISDWYKRRLNPVVMEKGEASSGRNFSSTQVHSSSSSTNGNIYEKRTSTEAHNNNSHTGTLQESIAYGDSIMEIALQLEARTDGLETVVARIKAAFGSVKKKRHLPCLQIKS